MSAQVQINNVDAGSQKIEVTGFVVLTGNYPTGGDPLNFTGSVAGTAPTAIADPSFIGLIAAVESSALLNVDVWSMSGQNIAAGNTTNYDTVATKTGNPALISPATGVKLKVGVLGTPNTEHAAGAYEASYLNDLIAFMAVFTKLL